jgi:hypothetical protein
LTHPAQKPYTAPPRIARESAFPQGFKDPCRVW